MCFHTFHFDPVNSLLDGWTSDLVCKHYDVCSLRFIIFYDPGADQNFDILDSLYSGCLKKDKTLLCTSLERDVYILC